MAIVVDPNLLSRADVIFGTAAQQISIYPVGDTERNGAGVEYIDCWVETSGDIESIQNFATDSVVAGDVVAVQNNLDAGHYYVETIATVTLTLADIDSGTAGAAITSLTPQQDTFAFGDVVGEQITGLTAHGYVTGDALVYRQGVSGDITLLPTDIPYYVIRISDSVIELADTYADAIAGTRLAIVGVAGAVHTLDDRLIVQVFNNGASVSEQIGGNDTSGDGDGDVLDGITQQAIYSFGKEEWRVDSQIADVDSNSYNDDLIRHQFPFEAITSEQFEVGGGTSHDNWNWFNSYTRKKVRTAGWAEKTDIGTGDLAQETGIITLGSIDADAQVYYQQTSVVTAKVDFTFLGPVNEALNVYADASANNTPEDDFTTFLKLFVRKKGRSYSGSTISDIGVTTIQTIVNRFPLAHSVDTAITLTDANLLGVNPYKFAAAPASIEAQADGDKTIGGVTFTSTLAGDFAAGGVIAGDILRITEADADAGYYEILSVATTTITIKERETVTGNDFTFNTGWAANNAATDFEIYSSLLSPDNQATGVLVESTATGLIDVTGVTGTLSDTGATFATGRVVEAGDIVIISNFYDISFDATADVGTDLITEADHNLRTGDRVIYDQDTGVTPVGGLTTLTTYYVSVASSSTFYLCATLDNAWSRVNGIADQITLSDGSADAQLLHVHEGDGCYPIISRDSTTVLTVDTTDYQFPTVDKAIGTTYHVVEAGMYLQYKDKTVQQVSGIPAEQTLNPLTALTFSATNTMTMTQAAGIGFDYLDDSAVQASIQPGDMISITGTTSNDGRYTVLSRTSALEVVIFETFPANESGDHLTATVRIERGFERTLGADDVSFNWKVSGNGGTLQNVYEFVQSELRSDATIDCGAGTFVPATTLGLVGFVGNINDLLMTFASPTGTGLNLFIDDLDSNDINNATFNDHAGNAQTFPFTSAGSLVFNPNLTNDDNSKYWLFFTNDDAGDNLVRDYGTENAIIVNSSTDIPITGFVNAAGGAQHSGGVRTTDSGSTSISFTYAYATNVQRGAGSTSTTAPVTLVAIGAPTAQFVIASGNITNATGITISAVAALERNYNGAL